MLPGCREEELDAREQQLRLFAVATSHLAPARRHTAPGGTPADLPALSDNGAVPPRHSHAAGQHLNVAPQVPPLCHAGGGLCQQYVMWDRIAVTFCQCWAQLEAM